MERSTERELVVETHSVSVLKKFAPGKIVYFSDGKLNKRDGPAYVYMRDLDKQKWEFTQFKGVNVLVTSSNLEMRSMNTYAKEIELVVMTVLVLSSANTYITPCSVTSIALTPHSTTALDRSRVVL